MGGDWACGPLSFPKAHSQDIALTVVSFEGSDLFLNWCLRGKKLRRSEFPLDENADVALGLCPLFQYLLCYLGKDINTQALATFTGLFQQEYNVIAIGYSVLG